MAVGVSGIMTVAQCSTLATKPTKNELIRWPQSRRKCGWCYSCQKSESVRGLGAVQVIIGGDERGR